MKIAVSGKGGSGKTLFSASLAIILSKKNKVYAIDADPDGNLGLTLGFEKHQLDSLTPISELKDLINERTGVSSNRTGFYILNPEVSDVPEKYSLHQGNLYFLLLGTLKKASSGCYCPENTFLKRLISHLVLERDEVVVIDLPAGIEVLTRGSAKNVDVLFIMVEPTMKSLQTALRIEVLAKELEIPNIVFIGNKIVVQQDIEFINHHLKKEIIYSIPFDKTLQKFEQQKVHLFETDFFHQVEKIISFVEIKLN